jgi:His/Glu/Gln/Arg/opine family amino acid ABC transporter permease subunit
LQRGALKTISIIPLCVLFSLIGGTILGIIQSKKIAILKYLINGYIIIMRGIPPLLMIMFFFFAANIRASFTAAVVALSLYHIGYITEIVRGGIEAIPKGQFEAAELLNLSSYIILTKVILPQVWYRIIPSLAGQYIILVKDTALVSVIGIQDILYEGRQLMQLSYKSSQIFLIFFLIGVFFFVICSSLQQLSAWTEKSFKRKIINYEGRI